MGLTFLNIEPILSKLFKRQFSVNLLFSATLLMKKFFTITTFAGFLFAFGLSCTSPFSPSTKLGQRVLNSIDTTLTDLKSSYRVIDSIDLPVQGARSMVAAGSDTGLFQLQAGDYPFKCVAGQFGDENAFAYAELQASSTVLSSIRASCSKSVDSIYLKLYYSPDINDTTIKTTNTIKVFFCERKFFPAVRNDLTTFTTGVPCTTLTFSRDTSDSFMIALGPEMVSRLNSAAADSSAVVRHIAKIDTVSDTVPVRFDTTFVYDTTSRYIGSISIVATGDGLVRFKVPPLFDLKYHPACTDTSRPEIISNYYDMCVSRTGAAAADSLVAAWQEDRFVEIPVNLKPLWEAVKSGQGGLDYYIVQNALCSLSTENSSIEFVQDSTMTIIYGLIGQQITDSRAHTRSTRDSLDAVNTRLATIKVNRSQTRLALPLTPFLQSLSDQGRPPAAYLYLFVKQPAMNFGRVVFTTVKTIRFSAVFAHPFK
jgi:hypothetical protein